MEQQLIDVLKRLPIAVRIVEHAHLDGTICYYWQAGESNGTSLHFVQAIEQALTSIFAFIATDASHAHDDTQNHPSLN